MKKTVITLSILACLGLPAAAEAHETFYSYGMAYAPQPIFAVTTYNYTPVRYVPVRYVPVRYAPRYVYTKPVVVKYKKDDHRRHDNGRHHDRHDNRR